MKAKALKRILENDGWYEVRTKGSHVQMKHPHKKGVVTVPMHGGDIPIGTLKSILKQAQLN